MTRYGDILRDASTSAPWEARSVNGVLHDRVDWFAVEEIGFPFPIARLSDDDPVRKEADAKGSWGYFELAGQSASTAGAGEANVWKSATTLPLEAGNPTLSSFRSLMEAARKNRVRRIAEAEPSPRNGRAPTSADAGSSGLAALAALRDRARDAEAATVDTAARDAAEDGSVVELDVPASLLSALAAGASPEEALARAGESRGGAAEAEVGETSSDDRGSGLAALARLRETARAAAASPDTLPMHPPASAAAAPVEGKPLPRIEAADILPARTNLTPGKRISSEQRIVVVGVDDPFAAHLLRGCLLASAQVKRVLPGLDGILSEKDLEDCAGIAYLSHALCPAEGWTADPDATREAEAKVVASASLGAFDASFIPENPSKAPDAQVTGSFAVLDFVGSPWIGDRLPTAFAYALSQARCAVVLAEPAREDIWRRLVELIDDAVGGSSTPGTTRRTLGFFSMDDRIPPSSRPQRRFMRAWWRWFGNGSRWGFHELGAQLDRAMGLLGFNLHQRSYDLGLVSIVAAQIRDGGTIASADDIADALADRFPDRELLQTMVDSAMELLVSPDAEILSERVFIPSRGFFDLIDRNAGAGASILAMTAVRSSPSLQAVLRLQGERLEVRFSTLFACLAARWFLEDPSLSLLHVADNLHRLSRRVPTGGWGRIVLQTVLLAEQRGQAFAGRVILDRLYDRASGSEERGILTEISLGVFLDASDGLPLVWRRSLFNGSVNARQARMLKETRDAGWLRSENLLVLRHSVDDLRRRSRARKDVGLKPRDMLKSCHWMDLLLCCLEARDAAQLLREIVADLDGRDEEARVRALGRYDCLVWACLFDIALPCPSLRRDALDPAPFAAVRDAALRELSEEGPAYDECARFAWIYGMEPASFEDDDWERILATAARIIEDSSEDDEGEMLERRMSAYQVLAAFALRKGRDRAAEDADGGGVGKSAPAPLSGRALVRMARDLEFFINAGDGDDALGLLMAEAAFYLITPSEAMDAFLLHFSGGSLTSLSRFIALLFAPNRARGAAASHGPVPAPGSEDDPLAQRDPERVAELRRRWRSCADALPIGARNASQDASDKMP